MLSTVPILQDLQLEKKLEAQMIYSQIDPSQEPKAASERVTFRHLAMLAQIRSGDDGVWESLKRSGLITTTDVDLIRRLHMMRTWIGSPHFPESFRLRIQTSISEQARLNLDARDEEYLSAVHKGLADCKWDVEGVNSVICNEARNLDRSLRDSFQVMYWIFLNQDFGPKLASILVEIERERVLNLLESAIEQLVS